MPAVDLPHHESWHPLTPHEAVPLLSVLRAPWWVAGGWALDLFEAKDGAFTQLVEGHVPRAEVNSLWCKRVNAAQWELELMLDESDGEFWTFRRDPRITRPLSSSIRRNPEGIAYLAPEIQLLYKARATRTQDQADFDHIVPHLDRDARIWLRESLMRTEPEHAWLSALKDNPLT
jgi:hypothetical protein